MHALYIYVVYCIVSLCLYVHTPLLHVVLCSAAHAVHPAAPEWTPAGAKERVAYSTSVQE